MIDLSADLNEFFRQRIVSSLGRRGLTVSPDTEFYLVDLMVRFAERTPAEALGRPFAERLAEATAAPGEEQLQHFRALGDTALYVCGFFSDYLWNKGVRRGYVAAIGHRAYGAASVLGMRSPWAATYPELAEAFVELANALDDVRETTSLRTPQDIVRLYDRWQRTRNSRLAERLHAAGVFPTLGDDDAVH